MNKSVFSGIFSHIKVTAVGLLQDRYIFKPYVKGVDPIHPPDHYGLADLHEITAPAGHKRELHLWYKEAPANDAPLYVVFHGNTGHWGDVGAARPGDPPFDRRYRINLLKAIAVKDAGILAVSLSGYGRNRGMKPGEQPFIADIEHIVNFVADHLKVPAGRIILLGESLGSANAIIAAEQMTKRGAPPAILGLIAPFSSMLQRSIETFPELCPDALAKRLRHPFKTIERLQHVSKNTLLYIVHPREDIAIPPSHSQAIADKAIELGLKTHHKLIDGGHISWDAQPVADDTLTLFGTLSN